MIKVSASNLERIAACPGSVAAEHGMPYAESDFAAEGKLLHDVMAGVRDTKGLTSSQRRYINYCGDKGRELLADHVDGEKPETVKEWYGQVRVLHGIVSSKADFVAWGDSKSLVIDWKFGHGPVEKAEANLQLRPYAIMAAQEKLAIELTTVAVVQPTVSPEDRVTVCQYTRDDIRQAREEIDAILKVVVENPDKRTPGAHCRYCKALGTARCPESAGAALALAPIAERDILPQGADLANLLDLAKILEPQIDRLREHARAELERDPESVPGYRIKPGYPIRTLPDVETAWGAASAAGVTPEEFMSACKVTVGQLEDAMRAKFGWKVKDTKSEFSRIMGEAITMDERRGSLERIK